MVTLNIDKREVRLVTEEGELVLVMYSGSKALIKKVTDILNKNLKDIKVTDFKEIPITLPQGEK
jgi:hypothetical protein